jgi:hypothetical protein
MKYCPHCGEDLDKCPECKALGTEPHQEGCKEGEWEARKADVVNRFLWNVVTGGQR